MARLLRIQRAIKWMAKVLTANRDALPFPRGMTDQLNPTIDVFGSQRMGEVQVETVQGGLGALEVFHDRVGEDDIRFYLSMEFNSDDAGVGSPRRVRPGRIFTTATGFPFAGMEDEVIATAGEFFAVRNFTVGPRMRAACRADGMGAGARMTMIVVWIETPLGEYLRSVQ